AGIVPKRRAAPGTRRSGSTAPVLRRRGITQAMTRLRRRRLLEGEMQGEPQADAEVRHRWGSQRSGIEAVSAVEDRAHRLVGERDQCALEVQGRTCHEAPGA